MSQISNTGKLAGKTLFITGASRGIGKSIALKAAKDGANIIIAAKTASPHPKLQGTIYTAAQEIEDAGGKCLPCITDIRNEGDIAKAVQEGVSKFGGIDILVNNASAIQLTGTLETPMKIFDRMMQVNCRGTFATTQACLPHLMKSSNPHVLNLSPPLNMKNLWFKNHCAYTMAKYGMSMAVLGMAEEFRAQGIAFNALWPRTAIATAAMDMLAGEQVRQACRDVSIVSDAAYLLLCQKSRHYSGGFYTDEQILATFGGVKNFDSYSVVPGTPSSQLMPDFFLDPPLSEPNESKTVKDQPSFSASALNDEISKVFLQVKSLMSPTILDKVKSVYEFEISDGNRKEVWFLDLKNSPGSCGLGPFQGADKTTVDCRMLMSSGDFLKIFRGELKPPTAFILGKLNITGNMGRAMKLQSLLEKINSKK
eukprot:Sdes_comp20782_c0_seq6m16885